MAEGSIKVKVVVGDWSCDGHCKTETIYLNVNTPPDVIDKAFDKSVEKTGFDFSKMCMDYGSYEADQDQLERLRELGIDCEEFYPEAFVYYMMQFIKLSLPDLEWEFISDDTPLLTRKSLGYGLFD